MYIVVTLSRSINNIKQSMLHIKALTLILYQVSIRSLETKYSLNMMLTRQLIKLV
jgi:hypothetical protein